MILSSLNYVIFLFISFFGYVLVPAHHRKNYLLFISFVFCSFFGISSVIVVSICILFNYQCGKKLEATDNEYNRRKLLVIFIIANVALLCFYKYAYAVLSYISSSFSLPALDKSFLNHKIVFPVGISFYIFQSISYLVDIHKRRIESERSILNYALFILFFPKFIAGPIERFSSLLPQILAKKELCYLQIRSGLILILWGMFQKIVIADRLAVYVNAVYAAPEANYGVTVWVAIVFYSFQIYCDFNGYTDIARGTARLFGFELSINFCQPYLATSVQDFWRRWHISLSSWLRDYIYIPLGGGRAGFKRKIINILIVFVICGVWHGSNWTFLVWGCLHGLFIVLEVFAAEIFSGKSLFIQFIPTKILTSCKILFTFFLVSLAWMFFRADTIYEVITLLKNSLIFDTFTLKVQSGLPEGQIILAFFLILFVCIVNIIQSNRSLSALLFAQQRVVRWTFYYVLIFSIILLPGSNDIAQFIYFEF